MSDRDWVENVLAYSNHSNSRERERRRRRQISADACERPQPVGALTPSTAIIPKCSNQNGHMQLAFSHASACLQSPSMHTRLDNLRYPRSSPVKAINDDATPSVAHLCREHSSLFTSTPTQPVNRGHLLICRTACN